MDNSLSNKYKTIYAVWTVICFCSLFLAPWLDTVNPASRQVGMIFLSDFIPVAFIVYGVMASVFLLLPGPKNTVYVWSNRIILSGVVGLFGFYWLDKLNDIDTLTNIRTEGRVEIMTERDYYRYFRQLKAIRVYRNMRNDSIWVKYNRLGRVTSRTVYK